MPTVSSDPVIVIPGITANYLRDDYPLPPETVWAVLPWTKDYDRVKLHPDDLRFEAREPAQVRHRTGLRDRVSGADQRAQAQSVRSRRRAGPGPPLRL